MTQESIPREKIFIVTHDCSIFSFESIGTEAIRDSFGCFFIPTINQNIYTAYNKGGDYMAINSNITESMIPSLYDNTGLVKSFTKVDIKVEVGFEGYFNRFTKLTKCTRDPRKRTTCTREKIEQVYISLGNDEDWGLEYSYFQGKAFENATLHYALTRESFLELCGIYNFYMFGEINLTRVSILDTQPHIRVNDTTIFHGKHDEIECIVKRGKVKTVGAYLNSFHIHRRLQEQENLLRIHDSTSICDGVEYLAIMEKCSGNLYEYMKANGFYRGRMKKLSRDVIKAMINMHDLEIVHGRIRPEHILVKTFTSLREVAKLGGISGYRKVTNNSVEPYKRDVYDMGRSMLCILSKTPMHILQDNDNAASKDYQNREPFKDDVQLLYKEDPLAAHLIEQCLSCKVSAKQMFNHPCFYKDGEYLEFMQRFSDTCKGDTVLMKAINKSQSDVIGASWIKPFAIYKDWIKKMNIGHDDTYTYNATRVHELLYLIRNVSHHFDDNNTTAIWYTPVQFERFILMNFPKLFPTIYEIVVDLKHAIFKPYWLPAY